LPFGANGSTSGSIQAVNRTELWGVEANAVFNVASTDCYCLNLLAGVRYLDLLENLNLTFVGDGPGFVFTTTSFDRFYTHNRFWGGQLGARAETHFGDFFASITAKVALGPMHENVAAYGISTIVAPGINTTVGGGIFAQASNSIRQSSNVFAVVPQVGVQAGYDVTCNVRVFAGYDFLYASNVVRPGDQLDHRINFDRQAQPIGGGGFVGPAVPVLPFNHTDFWAQGVSFGVQFSY
jgi:hypothetical protein